MRWAGIIFDFDGVLIDSEYEGNRRLAELLTTLGHPTSIEQALARFMGLAGADFHAEVERWIGGPIPPGFHDRRAAEDARVVAQGLPALAGAVRFVRALPDGLPRAIASSSSSHWISAHLAHVGLAEAFAGRIFSGREHVARGKPAPDIYLHAAAATGMPIVETLVIEDSTVGVRGAVASGATVVGLSAGRHCGPDHAARLRSAGAHHLATSFDEITALLLD